jgi:hypothetical protein
MSPLITQNVIKCKLLGDVQGQTHTGGFSIYSAEFQTKRYGRLTIVLNGNPAGKFDWPSLATRVDNLLPVLLNAEPRLRRAAVPGIRRLRRRYDLDDLDDYDLWRGTNAQLMACLTLTQINFSNDGTVEMWYSGGEPCNHLDVRLELGPRLALRKVCFDG